MNRPSSSRTVTDLACAPALWAAVHARVLSRGWSDFALRAPFVGALALSAAMLGACEPAGVSLTVRVVSGLRAEGDVDELEARLLEGASDCSGAEGRSARRPVTRADQVSLASTGVGVGAFEGLRPGTHAVLVTARGAGGVLVASRCTVVGLVNDRVLLVGLTTDCTEVDCPGAGGSPSFTECLNGRCVEPACAPDDAATTASCCDRALLGALCDSAPTLCGPTSACSGTVACVRARECVDGLCIEPSEDLCSDDEYCSTLTGACRSFDVGADAGLDASRADAASDPDATVGPDTGPELDAAPDLDAALEVDAFVPPDAAMDDAASPPDAGLDACVCMPGAVSAPLACGRCGSQTQSCGADCTWGPYGACSGEGPCTPGAVSAPASCGRCGTRTQTCGADCTWGPFGACGGEGVCTPGATSSRSCGTCSSGSQTRTCRSDCTWGSYGTCTGVTFCTDAFGGTVCPGARGERGGCSSMCTRTCTCSSTGSWISCAACPTPPC